MEGRSPSSPAGPRLWRPAAQRSIRNSWSSLSKQIAAWSSSSSAALASASSLVNSILSARYVKSLNFGALQAMEGIQTKACKKYFLQGERDCRDLLRSYRDLVGILTRMVSAKGSMRTYFKGPIDNPLAEFSNEKFHSDDTGDGDGLAVFSTFSVPTHEMLAQEILDMFILEIRVKWLIVSELHSLLYLGVEDEYPGKAASKGMMHELFGETILKVPGVVLDQQMQDSELRSKKTPGAEIKREVLQVYLTAWLTEVNIRMGRRDEILKRISDEIQLNLSPAV